MASLTRDVRKERDAVLFSRAQEAVSSKLKDSSPNTDLWAHVTPGYSLIGHCTRSIVSVLGGDWNTYDGNEKQWHPLPGHKLSLV